MRRWLGVLLTLTARELAAQTLPPIRSLGATVAVSSEALGSVYNVRPLPAGRLLANDVRNLRLLLFDSTLKVVRVVADTTGPNPYGPRSGGLIAFRGDSSLFVEQASRLVLVIDPDGSVARVISAPSQSDAGFLVGTLGFPAFDATGRLVYRNAARVGVGTASQSQTAVLEADTALVLRVDLVTRVVDTVAKLRVPAIRRVTTRTERGFSSRAVVNPLPITDDWAVLSDGSIALVRNQEFRVERLDATGRWTTTPRIPFEWRRLTDDEKVTFLDSARVAIERERETASPAEASRLGAPGPPPFITASELPDYVPPFMQNAARGDPAGNLWVRTTTILRGEAVHYVIDRSGVVIDRVLVPRHRTIVGFGTAGDVYLFSRERGAERLERVRLR
jgi:hypothetical protein